MTTAAPPPPIMPLPPPRSRVLRYLVASPEHAARLFPEGSTLRDRALDALARHGGSAVVVESFGGSATVATMPLANGHEVAAALAGIDGAVVFALRNLPVEGTAERADVAPPSRDPSLAAVEVEVVRLRKVEAAARALLASMPQCMTCKRVATKCGGPPGMDWHICDRHADSREHDVEYAAQVRDLEVLLAPVSEAAS